MNIAYWILAGLLAVFYLYSGGIKIVQSQDQLAGMMGWAGTAVPMWGVRVLGILEVMAAAGLVLPPLTGIAPRLALLAAVGLAILQLGALVFHLVRGESSDVWLNLALIVFALVVAVMAARLT